MKITNSGIFILALVFGIFVLLSLSTYSGISSITEGQYIQAYFVQIKKYYTADDVGTQVADSKKNTLDLIEYFLTTRTELSDFLWQKGANSGKQIRTILDMNEAPCVCDVNSACQATGDVCCCHQVQGVCDVVQVSVPKQWKSTKNCANGCCGDYCCGEEPTTNCYSNKQCYQTKGPCQACQKAGQDCVYETNQCAVDADCGKYASNWICNPSFKCCVPPQVTTTTSTTTTTLSGCRSDRQCVIESGPCYVCPLFGASCTLQGNQCTVDGDCTIRFGKAGGVTCNTATNCCNTPVECATNTDCENIYGPHWACYSAKYCTYYGTNTNCAADGTRIGQCNSAQQRCMDGPYGDAILATDTTYC
jgi:hypothetical protein